MKLVFVILAGLWAVGCSDSSKYLVKQDPAAEPVAEKVGDIEALTFTPEVDILFIVDSSGSMTSHQANLSNNVNRFVAEIANDQLLDYHIGVITSDMQNIAMHAGKLVGSPNYVTPDTPNGLSILQSNLLGGTTGLRERKVF